MPETSPRPDKWSVTVTIPARLPDAMKEALFTAVADAAHEWEPAERDGWDVDVTGCPTAQQPAAPRTDVPDELVDDAVDAWHDAPRDEHGNRPMLDDLMRHILAAVLQRMVKAALTEQRERAEQAEARAETAVHMLEHWADEHVILRAVDGSEVHADWCYRCRLERGEAAVQRSREALAAFDGRGVSTPEATDWSIPTPGEVLDAWRASLNQPGETPPAEHTGGNAEDCPVCRPSIGQPGGVLYPWTCPGPTPKDTDA